MLSPSTSKDSKADPVFKKLDEVKDTQTQAPPSSTNPVVDVEPKMVAKEGKGTSKGLVTETKTTKPPPAPKDVSKGGTASCDMEIVLLQSPFLPRKILKAKVQLL